LVLFFALNLAIAVLDRISVPPGVGLSLYRVISTVFILLIIFLLVNKTSINVNHFGSLPLLLFGFLFIIFSTSIFAVFKRNSLIYGLRYLEYTFIALLLSAILINFWKHEHEKILALALAFSAFFSSLTILTDFLNLTSFYKLFTPTRPYVRHIGILGEANYGAEKLCLILPFIFFLLDRYTKKEDWGKVLFVFIVITLVLFSIFLSGSRLAGILVLVQVIGLLFREKSYLMDFRLQVLTLLLLSIIFLILIISPFNQLSSAGKYIMKRYGIMVNFLQSGAEQFRNVTESSIQERIEVTKIGLKMFADRPFSGVGLGNFPNKIGNYNTQYSGVYSHNTYLSLLSETGIFGFFCFLFLLYYVGKKLFYSFWQSVTPQFSHNLNLIEKKKDGVFTFYLLLSFCSLLVLLFFLHDLSNKYLWTFFFPYAILIDKDLAI